MQHLHVTACARSPFILNSVLATTAPPCQIQHLVPRCTAVDRVNTLRSWHGAPPLKWDKNLASNASSWSDNCYFAHSSLPYGETLGMGDIMVALE
jgi:uncharacterized protein YkwD